MDVKSHFCVYPGLSCSKDRDRIGIGKRFKPHFEFQIIKSTTALDGEREKSAETIYFYSSSFSDHRRSVIVYQSACRVAESPLAPVSTRNCRMTMLLNGHCFMTGGAYVRCKNL